MDIYTIKDTDIVHNTGVDFATRSCTDEVHIVQYDNTQPIVAVRLFKDREIYSLPKGYEANLRFGKKDKTFIYKPVIGSNYDRTVVYFSVDEQMSLLPGDVYPIIELTYRGAVVGSSPIIFIIDRNPIQIGDIESKSDYPAIVERISEAQQDAADAKAAAEDAQSRMIDIDKTYATKTELAAKQDIINASNKLSASYVDGLAKVATTGAYSDLTGKPTIPTVSDAKITVKQAGKADQTFTLNGSAATISLDNTTYSDATTAASGLMSASDKTKLNGIAAGAEANVQSDWSVTDTSSDAYIKNKPTIPIVDYPVTDVKVNGSSVVSSKVASFSVPTKTSQITNDSGFLTSNSTLYLNKIENGAYNTRDYLNVVDNLLVEEASADKLAWLDPSFVSIEYSTDGGSTWIDSGYPASTKAKLFAHGINFTGGSFQVGGGYGQTVLLTSDNYSKLQSRVVITYPNGRYCTIDKCFMYASYNGHGLQVKTKYTTYGAQTTENLWRDNVPLRGWSGPNMFTLDEKRAFGANYGDCIYKLIFIFSYASFSAAHASMPSDIRSIRVYGNEAWGSYAACGEPYQSSENADLLPRPGFTSKSNLGSSSAPWNNLILSGNASVGSTLSLGKSTWTVGSSTRYGSSELLLPWSSDNGSTWKYASVRAEGGEGWHNLVFTLDTSETETGSFYVIGSLSVSGVLTTDKNEIHVNYDNVSGGNTLYFPNQNGTTLATTDDINSMASSGPYVFVKILDESVVNSAPLVPDTNIGIVESSVTAKVTFKSILWRNTVDNTYKITMDFFCSSLSPSCTLKPKAIKVALISYGSTWRMPTFYSGHACTMATLQLKNWGLNWWVSTLTGQVFTDMTTNIAIMNGNGTGYPMINYRDLKGNLGITFGFIEADTDHVSDNLPVYGFRYHVEVVTSKTTL